MYESQILRGLIKVSNRNRDDSNIQPEFWQLIYNVNLRDVRYGKYVLGTKWFRVNKQENQSKSYITKGTSLSEEWVSEEEEGVESRKRARDSNVGRKEGPWLMTFSLSVPVCPLCGEGNLGYLIPLPKKHLCSKTNSLCSSTVLTRKLP